MNPIQGDVNVVNHLLFGGSSRAMSQLIENNTLAHLAQISQNWGERMVQRTQEIFNNYHGIEVKRMVQAAVNQIKTISRPDVVMQLNTLEDFQTAKPVMQSYVMAEPYTRDMYHRNLCDGYSDTYEDPSPGIIGLGHKAYEHVMDGVLMGTPEKWNGRVLGVKDPHAEGVDVTRVNYTGAYNEDGELALSIMDKAAVLNTWRNLRMHFEAGEDDPVNPWGGSL